MQEDDEGRIITLGSNKQTNKQTKQNKQAGGRQAYQAYIYL